MSLAGSTFHAAAQLLQLAPNGPSSERVAKDDADEERGGDVDDVLERHGGADCLQRCRVLVLSAHSLVCGILAMAFCSSSILVWTPRILRHVCRMKSTVQSHISTYAATMKVPASVV